MKRFVIAAMVAAAMLFAPKAEAATIIDFSGNVTGGTITSLGGGHWSGSGIVINGMNAINTPLLAGFHAANAVLAFDTQANTISVTGTVPTVGINSSLTLLSGSFFGFTITQSGPLFSIFASGPDAKNPALLTALGLPTNTPFEFFGFSIGFSATGGPSSTYTAFSTDIANTAVPEPGSMVLLGTGLLGLAAIARRRLKKA